MKRNMYLVLVIIISILLSACMKQNDDENEDVIKKEKAPKTLIKVLEGIDNLLFSMDSIQELMELTEEEFQAISSQKENSQQKSNEDNNKSNEENQQDVQQQEQNQQEESKDEENNQQDTKTKDVELFMKWQEVDNILEEIHKSWNNYEVESMEKGAAFEKRDEFKEDLNALTAAVENRDINSIMNYGSKAFNSLSFFFDLYKDEIGGDLSRIKYSVYQAFLLALNGNNEEAKGLLEETQGYISRVRQKLEEDKIKDLEKLFLSISDMEKALDNNSMELLKIKRELAIENIKALWGQ